MNISIQDLMASQQWYLHAMDGSTASYCQMDDASFSASPFLDGRIVQPVERKRFKTRIDAMVTSEPWAKKPAIVPGRYILHISHVGSTLLSRVVGVSPSCLSLREPMPLRFLAQAQLDQGSSVAWHSPRAFDGLVDFALRNLGRPLGNRNRVVVKCTSWVNPLGEHFLAKDTGQPMRVSAVHMPLANFVANTLKGAGGLQDLRSNAQSRMRRLQKLIPSFDRALYAMNWGQIAAMSWLCEVLTIRSVCSHASVALQWVDFEAFMKDSASEARSLAHHLDLEWDDSTDRLLAQSGILDKYSKTDKAVEFSNQERIRVLEKFKTDNAVLMTSAHQWVTEVIADHADLSAWFGSSEQLPQL